MFKKDVKSKKILGFIWTRNMTMWKVNNNLFFFAHNLFEAF